MASVVGSSAQRHHAELAGSLGVSAADDALAVRLLATHVQRTAKLSHEVATLQRDIAVERDAVLSDLPSTCFFATFRSQQAAAIASQVHPYMPPCTDPAAAGLLWA